MPYTLTLRERCNSWAGRGPVITKHGRLEEAQAELVAYVRRNWDAEMDGDEPPADDEELVRQYFGEVLEDYAIKAG